MNSTTTQTTVTRMYIADDLVPVELPIGGGKTRTIVLCWGDPVRVRQEGDTYIALLSGGGEDGRQWSEVKLPKGVRLAPTGLLQLRFVDVGQGDGAILTSPSGKTVIVDGGQEEHMRHYVCVAYREEIEAGGLSCEAIVVTHGDSDHMSGLTEMLRGAPNHAGERRAVLRPARVFHNGLVKRPSRVSEAARLGPTERVGEVTYAVELTDDVRVAPADGELNEPFQQWRAALTAARRADGAAPEVVRLARGDDRKFDFLADDGVHVEVLGPIVESLPSGAPGLRLYGDPRSAKPSASQTINGHSVVLRVAYGNVRMLLCGDMTEAAAERLLARSRAEGRDLSAEVFKVPHHGTPDFSPALIAAVRPVISVISSGDEGSGTEYIHPRAEQLGALGRFAREGVEKPLIFVTELVAFFARARQAKAAGQDLREYTKSAFGIVHIRTDGRRLLVVTPSGKTDQVEAYAFEVADTGHVTPVPLRKCHA